MLMKTLFIILFVSFGIVLADEPITPIPTDVPYNKAKAKLGKQLFFETMLSKDESVACVSCHNIYSGGADPRVVSGGFGGQKGNIQSPTVLNAVFNFRQFWNGRARDLFEQAGGPLQNPVEHNMTPELVEQRLKASPYKKKFEAIYKNGVSFENTLDAIAEYEKTLTTPNSRFDLYLKGKLQLSKDEMRGYELFKQYGCVSCHNGKNVGGNSFAKIGLFKEYINARAYPDRYAITNEAIDKQVYKVPTLRNIELTAPYFHDGSQKNLIGAIKIMGEYNLGVEIKDKDLILIEEFLKTLTGKLSEQTYE